MKTKLTILSCLLLTVAALSAAVRKEFDIPDDADSGILKDEEIEQIYKKRWEIELLQMEKTASSDKSLLWHQQKRSVHSNLDSNLHVSSYYRFSA